MHATSRLCFYYNAEGKESKREREREFPRWKWHFITNPLRFIIRSYREKLNFLNIQDVAVTKTLFFSFLLYFPLLSPLFMKFFSFVFYPFRVIVLFECISEINRSVKSVFIAIRILIIHWEGLKFRKQSLAAVEPRIVMFFSKLRHVLSMSHDPG